jgi:hypothetical protein
MGPSSRCQRAPASLGTVASAQPNSKHWNQAAGQSGLPVYNVMVNSLFNPVAPLSPSWAIRMCNEAGGEPKSAV